MLRLAYYELSKIFISTIFLISSLGKLSGLSGFQASLTELELNKKAARVISYGVPIVELCLSVLLMLGSPYSILAEFGIFILLVGFSWSVWRARQIGSAVKCNCFGNLVNEKLGPSTIAKIVFILVFDLYLLMNNHLSRDITDFPLSEICSMVYSSVSLFLIYSVLMFVNIKRPARKA